MSSLADDTRWLDATAQAELVASGKVTPLEMVNAAIERVERYDGALNALTYRWFEAARELASSNTLPDGPFRGVPYLLKDSTPPKPANHSVTEAKPIKQPTMCRPRTPLLSRVTKQQA